MSSCGLREEQRRAGTLCKAMLCEACSPFREQIARSIAATVEDSAARDQMRFQAAVAAMQAIISKIPPVQMYVGDSQDPSELIARGAVDYADALLAELQKEPKNG